MELEIKLTVLPGAPGGPGSILDFLALVPTLGEWPLGPTRLLQVDDVYYDTRDRTLRGARIGLRRRRHNGRALVTVKMGGSQVGGLAQREEHEAPLNARSLARLLAPLRAAGLLPDDPVPWQAFAAGRPCGPLLPVLHTSTRRRERPVRREDGDHSPWATLCLDEVAYALPGQEPYFDIEVESAGATASDLRQMAQAVLIWAGGWAAPAPMSKLARGLRLAGESEG